MGRFSGVEPTEENLSAMLSDLFRLHQARWNGRGVLQGLEAFHDEVARGFLHAGMPGRSSAARSSPRKHEGFRPVAT